MQTFCSQWRVGKAALLIEVSTSHIGLQAPVKSVPWKLLTNWASNMVCKPHKNRGRPSARWDDSLTDSSSEFFHNDKSWHIETSAWFTSDNFTYSSAQFLYRTVVSDSGGGLQKCLNYYRTGKCGEGMAAIGGGETSPGTKCAGSGWCRGSIWPPRCGSENPGAGLIFLS